jgi:uncharacterized membrane protein
MTATHLHAMIIHFPIALLIVGFLSEIIGLFTKKEFFKTAAFYLLILGSLGAITAYVTGGYAGEGIEEGPLLEPMSLHEEAAFFTLWVSIITVLFKSAVLYFKYHKLWVKFIGFLLYLLLVVAVARTGYLGGQLVFSHGAGVELALPDFNN